MGFIKRTLDTIFTIKRDDEPKTTEQNKAEFKRLLYYVGIFAALWLLATISKKCNSPIPEGPSLQEKIDSLENVVDSMKNNVNGIVSEVQELSVAETAE